MSKRKPDVYLQDILESIEHIQKFLDGVSENKFYENVEKQDAVLRRLEIIGEAVKHLSEEIREGHPDIPWPRPRLPGVGVRHDRRRPLGDFRHASGPVRKNAGPAVQLL